MMDLATKASGSSRAAVVFLPSDTARRVEDRFLWRAAASGAGSSSMQGVLGVHFDGVSVTWMDVNNGRSCWGNILSNREATRALSIRGLL